MQRSASESVTTLVFLGVRSRACDGSNPFTCKWSSRDVIPSNPFHLSWKRHQYIAAVEFDLSKSISFRESIYCSKFMSGQLTPTPSLLYPGGYFIFNVRKSSEYSCKNSLGSVSLTIQSPPDQRDKCGWGTWETALDPPLLLSLRCILNPSCFPDLLSSCQTRLELQLPGVNVIRGNPVKESAALGETPLNK